MTPDEIARDESVRKLIQDIAIALVDEPDAVSVEVLVDRNSSVIKLRVAAGDAGKVIGKQGRTARSIRTVLAAASMKLGWRYVLDIPP
jgi:predicted RNA-binding protein YlqC (UPF0109 family)